MTMAGARMSMNLLVGFGFGILMGLGLAWRRRKKDEKQVAGHVSAAGIEQIRDVSAAGIEQIREMFCRYTLPPANKNKPVGVQSSAAASPQNITRPLPTLSLTFSLSLYLSLSLHVSLALCLSRSLSFSFSQMLLYLRCRSVDITMSCIEESQKLSTPCGLAGAIVCIAHSTGELEIVKISKNLAPMLDHAKTVQGEALGCIHTSVCRLAHLFGGWGGGRERERERERESARERERGERSVRERARKRVSWRIRHSILCPLVFYHVSY
jgi:hypothetical protein